MTTWLTRIAPDVRHQLAAADLTDAVGMHRTVMRLFPANLGDQARQAAGVLFRLDEDPQGTSILIQSGHEPDPARLPNGYGTIAVRSLDPLMDALRPGLPVRYRLTANSSRKLGRNTQAGKPLSIVPLHGVEAEQWWARQAEQSGLELRIVTAMSLDTANGIRTDRTTKNHQRQHHARTRFDGTAVITDPDTLRERITTGIGRAKSYGCGLLTLAPAR